MISHPIAPVWDKNSEILILGSFPSVKSRENLFFYAHKQNRFWRVLSSLLNAPIPTTIEEKKHLLIENGIALWDVIASCDITNSSDSSIKNAVPNDLSEILSHSKVKTIYTNGKTAEKLYQKYIFDNTGIKSVCLPSTSPANAAYTFDMLIEKWHVIIEKQN